MLQSRMWLQSTQCPQKNSEVCILAISQLLLSQIKQAKNGLQLRSTLLEIDTIMDYHGLSLMTIMDDYHG